MCILLNTRYDLATVRSVHGFVFRSIANVVNVTAADASSLQVNQPFQSGENSTDSADPFKSQVTQQIGMGSNLARDARVLVAMLEEGTAA